MITGGISGPQITVSWWVVSLSSSLLFCISRTKWVACRCASVNKAFSIVSAQRCVCSVLWGVDCLCEATVLSHQHLRTPYFHVLISWFPSTPCFSSTLFIICLSGQQFAVNDQRRPSLLHLSFSWHPQSCHTSLCCCMKLFLHHLCHCNLLWFNHLLHPKKYFLTWFLFRLSHFFFLFLPSLSHFMEITDSFGLLCPILAHDQSTIWSFGLYSKPYQQPFTTRKI